MTGPSNAETRTGNDELSEDKVISLSSSFVEKSETLKKSTADGLVKVRIRATVRISKVIESLKAAKISVADIDAQCFLAVIIAPASVPRSGVSYFFPKFSCERTSLLAEEEVRKLSKISVELR